MDTKDDGGPAFPRAPFDVNDYCGDGSPGMTLRDWFAGQADISSALGLLHREGCEALIGQPMPNADDMVALVRWHFAVVAHLKHVAADAMLEARK